VTLAHDAGAKRLVLFHHEPEHSDEMMDGLLKSARAFAKKDGRPLEVLAALEGMQLTL
jgi:phosphoribosyl 1,2-cyclic phosphodiesterase